MNTKQPKKLHLSLLWLLRYDFHTFVSVHALMVIDAHWWWSLRIVDDQQEEVQEFYCLHKWFLWRIRNGKQKKLNFYLLWFLRYDCHKFVPVTTRWIILHTMQYMNFIGWINYTRYEYEAVNFLSTIVAEKWLPQICSSDNKMNPQDESSCMQCSTWILLVG